MQLPAPNLTRLPRAPLTLVIAQLRFGSRPADFSEAQAVANFIEARGCGSFRLDQISQQAFSLTFGPGGASPAEVPAGEKAWRLTQGPVTVTLADDALTVETTHYEDWPTFGGAFGHMVEAVHAILQPSHQARLGVRMVNKISEPGWDAAIDAASALQPWLRGPLLDERISDAAQAHQQQVEFATAEDQGVVVRSALFRDNEQRGRFAYLVDLDAFRIGLRPFTPDDVTACATELNALAVQFFQASISTDMYEAFAHD